MSLRCGGALALLMTMTGSAAAQSPGREIDAGLWATVSAAMAAGDLAAFTKAYHPDAVLVNASGTRPATGALLEWGRWMADARAAGGQAKLAYRFALRLDDATTAFESGVYQFTALDSEGRGRPRYTRFEALLVKHEGRWVIMMERQLDRVEQADWDALK